MFKHKTLFIAGAITLVLYGLIYFLIPAVGLNLHGHAVDANDLASVIARYWGSAYICIGVILWLARKGDADSYGVRASIWGGLVGSSLGLVAAIIDMIVGKANAMIWLPIVLLAFFAVWFGYFAFKKPA